MMKRIIKINNAGKLTQREVPEDYQLAADEMWPQTEAAVVSNGLQQQVAILAYQQMTTQQTITDLQAQNAQMAYQLMTQGGVIA